MTIDEGASGEDRTARVRGTLIGCGIGAIAGIVWSLWGAFGLLSRSVPWAVVIGTLGVAVGVLLLVFNAVALRRVRTAPATPDSASTSMFSSRRYRITVIIEGTAMVAGVIVLGSIDHPEYIPALIAIIVGLHFLGFLASWRGFALLSIALVVAGAAGVVVGLLGGRSGDVAATVGVIAAVSLFCSAARVFTPSSKATH